VVFNFAGGTEFLKFHPCIRRTFRNWKNEMWFLQNLVIHSVSAQNEPGIGLTPNPWNLLDKPQLRTTASDKSNSPSFYNSPSLCIGFYSEDNSEWTNIKTVCKFCKSN